MKRKRRVEGEDGGKGRVKEWQPVCASLSARII
jgi:hypothetical protein